MGKIWWKILAVVLVLYSIIGGFLMDVPRLDILNETIRNLYFHVTQWFAMMIILTASLVYSIKYLRSGNLKHDLYASEAANIGIFLGCLGIATGSVWAKYTWGDWWVNDPKLNGAAISLLIYLAYIVLRGSIREESQRARVAAVYNVFAFVLFIVFIWILPRQTDSLHPGNGGNPGFSAYQDDLDSTMRMVFYPAIIGWTLLAVWIMDLKIRMKLIKEKLERND